MTQLQIQSNRLNSSIGLLCQIVILQMHRHRTCLSCHLPSTCAHKRIETGFKPWFTNQIANWFLNWFAYTWEFLTHFNRTCLSDR